ncbi:MAG TPA: hypothetical protein PK413_21965, partial [Thermoanaerobaculia bacterium]|nr:hypothetical protein [Thermoanaerobaculia bacterium]
MADEETPTPGTESDAFAASLAAKITGETPAVEAPASEENPPLAAPQRDEKGRFVAGAPAASEEEPEVEGTLSPEAQARIREQEAFIGRQSTEIGELRARLEAIEKAQSEPETVEPQGFPQVYITPEQAEAVVERAGPYDAVLAACQDGLDPDGTAFKNIFDAAAEAVESQSQLADLVELRIQYREFLADDGEV